MSDSMRNDAPAVSVIMPTYNHAPFVAQAIRSVLDQTFGDFEFVITNDGSTDTTSDVLAQFVDPRIRCFPSTVNRGTCIVSNELIGRARGKYVAVINSDDFWEPDKLAYQVAFLDSHPEYHAMFGRARFVDREGATIDQSTIELGATFDQGNRSSAMWLRHFFEKGNCLCHPTLLIRRDCLDVIGLLDNRLLQLHDYDLWIRLAKHFNLFVSDRILINFRILPGENISAPTRVTHVRTMNEHFLIAHGFFDGMKPETLMEGFSDLLRNKFVPSQLHADIEEALLFFHDFPELGPTYKVVGMEKLYGLLGSPEHRRILLTDYGFDDRSFHKLTGEAQALKPEPVILKIPVPGPHVLIDVFPPPETYIVTFPRAVIVNDLKRRLVEKFRRAIGLGGRGDAARTGS